MLDVGTVTVVRELLSSVIGDRVVVATGLSVVGEPVSRVVEVLSSSSGRLAPAQPPAGAGMMSSG